MKKNDNQTKGLVTFVHHLNQALLRRSRTCFLPRASFLDQIAFLLEGQHFFQTVECSSKKRLVIFPRYSGLCPVRRVVLLFHTSFSYALSCEELAQRSRGSTRCYELLSTVKGVLTPKQAINHGIGGRLLLRVEL